MILVNIYLQLECVFVSGIQRILSCVVRRSTEPPGWAAIEVAEEEAARTRTRTTARRPRQGTRKSAPREDPGLRPPAPLPR